MDTVTPNADDHKDGTPRAETQETTAHGMDSPIEYIKVTDIQIPPTVRADWENLDYMQNSLQTNGLYHPILVKRQGDMYELLSGHNRLQAAKNLGWTTIRAQIKEFSEDNALRQELIVLDENLCRDELNHLEYAEALGRTKEIYETLYPQTKHNGSKKNPTLSHLKNGSEPPRRPAFLDDTARKLGRSRSSLGNYVYIY